MIKTKKGDFVEIEFTGYYDGKVFDSNIAEDLKQLDPKAAPEKNIIVIGEKMVVPGLDKALEDKELNQEYKISLTYKEGFGERKRDLVKTIPLKVFTSQKINPRPGVSLLLDNHLAKVITVSGARVITDFNNPLAGKDIEYKFKIIRIVTDLKEKSEAFFQATLRHVPELEVEGDKVLIKGPKPFEGLVNAFKEQFKKLVGAELGFKEVEEKKETQENSTN